MGASKVKWTTPNPCLVLNESDSNYILTLNSDLQSQAIYDDKNNSKKILHISKDNASDIEQATISNLFEILMELH
jgi:hypothetical protein